MEKIILRECRNIIFNNPQLFPISEHFHNTMESKELIYLYIENCIGLKEIINSSLHVFESIRWATEPKDLEVIKKSFIRYILLCYSKKFPSNEEITEFNKLIS